MQTRRLFRTSTFRFALLYMALFGASGVVLLGVVYWSTLAVIDRQIAQTVNAEIRGLAEQYRNEGLRRLVNVIAERSGPEGNFDNVYLLTDPELEPLAGNLSQWPASGDPEGDWVDLVLERRERGKLVPHQIHARTFLLPGGFHLLVGRDTSERTKFRGIVLEALAWALAVTLALGLVGGLVISRNMLRRVDAVAAASRRIVHGDLAGRVPLTGSGDELDRLAQHLNEMLDQVERLMTGMRAVTDSLGHDLRSPLTRLKGRIELALRGPDDIERYRETLDEAIAEIDSVLGTFNALTSIAQAEAGAGREEMTEVDLGQVGRDVADLYEPLAEDKGLSFEAYYDEGLTVRGHPQLLAQAASNLLDNAIKYTPAGGTVGLSVSRAGARVSFTVYDTGPGIPPEDRERVLARFERLDSSRSTPGSGLGLSLVAAVAKLHGAELTLGDNGPGLRATLRFGAGAPAARAARERRAADAAA